MTNDAMTKSEAARERVTLAFGAAYNAGGENENVGHQLGRREHFDKLLTAYGDARAVEAEIAALMKVPCDCGGTGHRHVNGSKRICGCTISTIQCHRCRLLADAEQRERGMG